MFLVSTFRSRQFLLAFLANFAAFLSFALTFRIADFLSIFSTKGSTAGSLIAFGVAVGVVVKFALGKLSHRFGIFTIWSFACGSLSLGHLVFCFGPGVDQTFYLGRALQVIGYASCTALGLIYVQQMSSEKMRSSVISLYGASSFLALMVASFIFDALGTSQTGFWWIHLIGSASAFFVLAAVLGLAKTATKNDFLPQRASWNPWCYLQHKTLIITALLLGALFSIPQLFLAILVQQRNLPLISAFFMSYAIASFFSRLFLSPYISQRPSRNNLLVGFSLFAAAQAQFVFCTTSLELIVAGILTGAARTWVEPTLIKLGGQHLSIEDRATGTSSLLAFVDIGLMMAAPFLGFCLDSFGLSSLFVITSCLALVGAVSGQLLSYSSREADVSGDEVRNKDLVSVLISSKVDPLLIKYLERSKVFHYRYLPNCTPIELTAEMNETEILICRVDTPIDRKLVEGSSRLKLIATATAGVNHIDISALQDHGIDLVHCPGQNARSTAEFTLGLMLSTLRKIPQSRDSLLKGFWQRHLFVGEELHDKLVGIWGYGAVGKTISDLCQTLGARVRVFDPGISSTITLQHPQIEFVDSLEALASGVNILSLHVPVLEATVGKINRDILERMAEGSILINAARGALINEDDLLGVLNTGHLASCGMDTWQNEPTIDRRLIRHPKIVATPHIAGSTIQAQKRVAKLLIDYLTRYHDQRTNGRQPVTAEIEGKIVISADEIVFAKLVNISSMGIGLCSATELNEGGTVEFILGSFKFEGTIRWSNKDARGAFHSGLHVDRESMEELFLYLRDNRSDRVKLSASDPYREVFIDQCVVGEILNLSSSGLALQCQRSFQVGDDIKMKIAASDLSVAGTIVWRVQKDFFTFHYGVKSQDACQLLARVEQQTQERLSS
ncbi:MFS transporter [Oligoflexaceae bacterium]|nr:MFS transporter [Oligoflexaceae bacterium]